MSRAILTAPVARNLTAEFRRNVIKIPDATNGVLQAWDTMDREFYIELADPDITIYTRRQDVPAAIRSYLIMVRVLPSAVVFASIQWDNAPYKRFVECGAADYMRIVGGTVKTRPTFAGGDKPLDWTTVHNWAGVPDELGEN